MRNRALQLQLVLVCAVVSVLAAEPVGAQARQLLSGKVMVDGSSTVAPITMAAAELFESEQHRVQVTVSISGTGGGFKKFLEKRPGRRTDINDASRPIKPSELKLAQDAGVEFIELPLAYDGVAVVVNSKNTFCKDLTIEELRKIWEPNSKIRNWKDVRPGFPDLPLKLYGPGADSGTFDYFVETVVGKARACRSDFTPSEDDNVLVLDVAGDEGGLGYFGFSYYENNVSKLNLVSISQGDSAPVKPSLETIHDGAYAPLSRPLFLYVNVDAAERPEVKAFLSFVYTNARKIVQRPKVNYVALSPKLYKAGWARLENRTTGSVFADPANRNKSLPEIYGVENE